MTASAVKEAVDELGLVEVVHMEEEESDTVRVEDGVLAELAQLERGLRPKVTLCPSSLTNVPRKR